jgi:hypothetical protein
MNLIIWVRRRPLLELGFQVSCLAKRKDLITCEPFSTAVAATRDEIVYIVLEACTLVEDALDKWFKTDEYYDLSDLWSVFSLLQFPVISSSLGFLPAYGKKLGGYSRLLFPGRKVESPVRDQPSLQVTLVLSAVPACGSITCTIDLHTTQPPPDRRPPPFPGLSGS